MPWLYVVHPPTKQPRNILTHTERLPNVLSAEAFYDHNILFLLHFTTEIFCPPDILLVRHFVPVMFYYCDILSSWHFITAAFYPHEGSLLHHFGLYMICTGSWRPPYFLGGYQVTVLWPHLFLPGLWQESTFAIKQNVDVMSEVTEVYPEMFWLGLQRVGKM
jgi:hypothetical protein